MDEKQSGSDADDAARALAALAETRARWAQRAHWPFHRHLAVGLLLGLLVASNAFPPAVRMAAAVVVLVAVALIVRRDRRKDGFFVNGYRAGRTRRVAVMLAFATVLMLAGGVAGKELAGLAWAPIVAGLVTAAIGTAAGYAWERAYRADLAERP